MVADSSSTSGFNIEYVRLFHVLCCEERDLPPSSHTIRLNRIYKMEIWGSQSWNTAVAPRIITCKVKRNHKDRSEVRQTQLQFTPQLRSEQWGNRTVSWVTHRGLAGWRGELHDCRQRMWHTRLTLTARRATWSLCRSKYGKRKRETNTEGRKTRERKEESIKERR